MTPQQIDAMKLALEAHCKDERHHTVAETQYWCRQYKLIAQAAIAALSEHAMREVQRLGQEIEQEPVAYFHPHKGFYWAKPTSISAPTIADVEPLPLYTHPPQRTWVDVPDEGIKILWIQYRAALPRYLCFAKALLARAKEENT